MNKQIKMSEDIFALKWIGESNERVIDVLSLDMLESHYFRIDISKREITLIGESPLHTQLNKNDFTVLKNKEIVFFLFEPSSCTLTTLKNLEMAFRVLYETYNAGVKLPLCINIEDGMLYTLQDIKEMSLAKFKEVEEETKMMNQLFNMLKPAMDES